MSFEIDAFALGGGQASERLIEQEHARAGGQRKAHVEQPLAAIGERTRLVGLDPAEAHGADHACRLPVDLIKRGRAHPRIERLGKTRLHGEAHVLADRQRQEQVGDLERAPDARAGYLFGCEPANAAPGQRHTALVGGEHARNQVEGRGLARAVRADQCMQRAVTHGEIDALHGLDAAEGLGDAIRLQHMPVAHRRMPEIVGQGHGPCLARRHGGVAGNGFAERLQELLGDAHQPGWREHDEADEEKPEPEQPVFGSAGKIIAENHEKQRTQRRAEERAHTADHDHGEQFAREGDGDRLG
jgi:hypothetical protein